MTPCVLKIFPSLLLCHYVTTELNALQRETKADTLKQLRPIGKGDQVPEKRLDQKELT
jgi:hypothetical protein